MKPQSFVILVGALMVAAVGLLVVGPAAHKSGVTPAPTPVVQPTPRLLTVTGESNLWVKPNVVYLSIVMKVDGASAQEAEALTGAFADTLQKRLETQKLRGLDIQVGSSHVGKLDQTNVPPAAGPVTRKPYQASITVYVRTSDLNRIDDVRNLALEVGGDLTGATYTLLPDDAETARKSALAGALQSAAARAQVLAGQGGSKLGELQNVTAKIAKNLPDAYEPDSTLGPTGLVEVRAEATATYTMN